MTAASEDAQGGISAAIIARRFHSTLVRLITATCDRIRGQCGLNTVALSGGVFLNALLTRETVAALSDRGFRVVRHRLVPPNDGGLSLGQIAIAAASLAGNPVEGEVNVPRDSRQSCRDLPRA
jgi:hydrogenase maturation protein HypF